VIADLVDITRLATADPSTACRTWPSSRTPDQHRDPADGGSHHQLLPAHERERPAGRAGRPDPHPGRRDISIDAMLQKEPADGETRTDIIFLTHQTQEKNVLAAIAKIEGLATVCGSVTKIRLENLA
jgi:homoserine dehydrogenase